MSPAHVLEPTYAAIKQRLLDGDWPPGSRLESARIADMVGVSMTPVRDSLNRLVGERLVDLRPGFGFHVPRLCAFELRQLLELNLALVRLALSRKRPGTQRDMRTVGPSPAERTRTLFGLIARAADNEALVDAVESLSDRLNPFRRLESQALADVESEIGNIELLITGSDSRASATAVRRYHQRRISAAPRLVAVLQQAHASNN